MAQKQDKHYDKRRYWQEILTEWESSGQRATHFCHEKRVSLEQFRYWQRHLAPNTIKPHPKKDEDLRFIEIQTTAPTINPEAANSGTIEIKTPYGFTILLTGKIALAQLSHLFNALKGML